MLVVEGTYENGEVHLDAPVTYQQPVRVRVEFLEEQKPANRPRFSWDEALSWPTTPGVNVSDAVIEEREEERG
ncbi:MAG: hypothetical protein ACRYFX_27320 [Janthinobacterium lividum]